MSAKRRKPGDWKALSAQRGRKERSNRTGRGLTNIPNVTDTGSAAYRRLERKLGK